MANELMSEQNGFNWQDYVAFDTPVSAYDSYESYLQLYSGSPLDPKLQSKVETAFDEIAETPEGRAAILNAVQNSPDGLIHIVPGNYASPKISPDWAVVGIPPQTSTSYYSPDNKMMNPMSLQHALYHELTHLGQENEAGKRKDDCHKSGLEDDATSKTNQFMSKYYGEPDRGDYYATTPIPARDWELNSNFETSGHPENKAGGLSALFDARALGLSPLDPAPSVEPALDQAARKRVDLTTQHACP